MITFLDGLIDSKQPACVVMNVGGIGYEVLIPLSTFDQLPHEGAQTRLLTHHHVKEDIEALYGFATDAERSMFRLLLSISKIGPKIALSILSGLNARELKRAVIDGDRKRLSSINGVGPKMAERMIVELKDKFSEGETLEAVAGDENNPADVQIRDAVLALVALGYKQADAIKMINAVSEKSDPSTTVEDLVRLALTS